MKENRLIRRHCKKYMSMRHNTRVHLLVCNIQWCCNLCFVSSSQVNWQHRKRSKRRRVSWMEMDYQDYSPVMNSMYVQLGCPTWECMWGERSGTRILLKTLWRAGSFNGHMAGGRKWAAWKKCEPKAGILRGIALVGGGKSECKSKEVLSTVEQTKAREVEATNSETSSNRGLRCRCRWRKEQWWG